MRDRWKAWSFGALFLALTSPGFGQNLVINSEFDDAQGLDSWSNVTGSWVLATDSASCPQSSSAEGTSGTSGGGSQYLGLIGEDCVAVDPVATPTLYLGASYRTTATVWARFYLQFFTDGACGSFDSYSGAIFDGPSATWKALLGEISVPTVAGSLRVWVDFNPQELATPQFVASVDRIYLGTSARLFLDAFEAEGGSACRWSSSVGIAP